ncbi:MAG: DUF554 domain-containing protein [Succinivibrio sp.]|nr:DUF554 domain-containing protein [Succinivibrio sp.]
MIAVIINTLAIMLGVFIGLWLRRGMSAALSDAIMKGLGLCTVVIGIQGTVREENVLILIVCTVVGILLGEAARLDERINRQTERLTSKFAKGEGQGAKIAEAFVTSCLIMNVGAMVIVGSLDAGLREDYSMLYTKSLLDLVSGIMLTAAMGVGVMGSALFTLVFQGAIVLCAQSAARFLSSELIEQLSCVGCVMILAIGLNMLELTRLKVLNMLPSLLAVPFVLKLWDFLPSF